RLRLHHDRRSGTRRPRSQPRLWLEQLEERTLMTTGVFDPARAVPLSLPSATAGAISATGEEDFFAFTVGGAGRLVARAAPASGSSLDPRLTLLTSDGRELVRSDDVGAGDRTSLIDQHLVPGAYFLGVSAQAEVGPGSGGNYRLQTEFAAGLPPLESITLRLPFDSASVADVNGDGRPDLIDGSGFGVSVLLGNGDGSFQPPRTTDVEQSLFLSVSV